MGKVTEIEMYSKGKSLCDFFFFFFFFVCFGSSLLRVGFLYLRRAGATLRCGARASHCSGFSLVAEQGL